MIDFRVLLETTVSLKFCRLLYVLVLFSGTLDDGICHRCRAIERAECSDNHTEDHRKCERTDRVAAEEEDAEKHEQCRERRVDRSGKRGVQSLVESLETIFPGIYLHHLTHTVEHNHRIVDLITDDGQDSRYERLVNLHREWEEAPAD